jgi:hypothetical protein
MSITLTCSCGKQLQVADEFAGRQGRCPVCGGLLEIPERAAVVSGAGPSPPEAAEAVTTAPGWEGPAAPAAPEEAVTAQSPEAEGPLPDGPEIIRPPYKLFSPGCIGLVAFLAGPGGAFLLLAINYWRLGKRGAAWITLAFGLLTIAALVAISVAVPEPSPLFVIGLPLFLILWIAAKVLQGGAYDAHLRNGGEPASGGSAAGLAVLGLVLYFGLFLGGYLACFNTIFGQKIDFGGGEEIYYAWGATEADARALGAFLRQAGYFDGRSPKTARIARDGNRLVLTFVVQDWVPRDPQAQQQFRAIGQQASQLAFGGRPVAVELCDQYFNVKKRL